MQESGVTTLRLTRPIDPAGPDGRLAELVAHLTGCAPTTAVDAVSDALPDDHDLGLDDRLEVVARAMVRVRREQRLDLRDTSAQRRPA
jgi:hypothetical protein